MKKIIFILCVLFSNLALAENWYRVEVIVFENLYPQSGGEIWNKYPGLPNTQESVRLIRALEGDEPGVIAFQSLDNSRLTLTGTYSRLKKSSHYRPLKYIAWQQPEMSGSNARNVKLEIRNQSSEIKISGNVRIRSSLYLHVDVDLAYFLQAIGNIEGIIEEDIQGEDIVTRLHETRRIKLNEIHYFDHPLFGAIVRVVRLGDVH